ncbi:unnamed protein product, partial [Meganyctiphanes norvegica]
MPEEMNGLEKSFVELHKAQLETSDVPKHLWSTIFRKLHGEIYDAGEFFQICQVTRSDNEVENSEVQWKVIVIKPEGIKASHPNNVFLIDHAWTYRAEEARKHLQEMPVLLERMASLMDISQSDTSQDDLIQNVLNTMWKYNNTYSLVGKTAEERLPVWYIMDEFGCRIQHCGEPNFRMVPLYYSPHQCCYSILFPIEETEIGQEVQYAYLKCQPLDQLSQCANVLKYCRNLATRRNILDMKSIELFQSYRRNESVPDDINIIPLPSDRPIKVYADYRFIREYLTDKRFAITENQEEADILWFSEHFKDFKNFSKTPHRRVNQFPCENVVTVKDMLAVVCRRRAANKEKSEEISDPFWLPTTYCLKRELVQFVALFQRREKRGLDNHWIVKPWNLARGLDHSLTDNINHILRLPSTGPKIAQKYLSDPVLFHRNDINADVKFDLRFIVMLVSVKPLKVAVYRRFWIRFANEKFDLTQLDNYQKHFTVNNYNDTYLLQMFCTDFINKWNTQYPDHQWDGVEKDLYDMFLEVFRGATAEDAPAGIPNNTQCAGSYGFDVMIDWQNINGERVMQPKLLEVNFNSDCKRACEYYPEFFNDIFSVMFLHEFDGHNVALLE